MTLTEKRMQNIMTLILLIGTLLAIIFVFSGGLIYLLMQGGNKLQVAIHYQPIYPISIWRLASEFTFSAVAFIEIGLIILVITQIIRVGLLIFYYFITRDYQFTFISLFIFFILLYSFLSP